MKPSRASSLLLIIVVASSTFGVALGQIVGRKIKRRAQPVAAAAAEAKAPVRRVVAVSDPREFAGRGNSHAHLELVQNLQTPGGKLAVMGTLQIGEGLKERPGYLGRPFAVDVTVRDEKGVVVIEGDRIGQGMEEPGKGYWQQDFAVEYDLKPGRYRVDMIVHNPTHGAIQLDGSRTRAVIAAVENLHVTVW